MASHLHEIHEIRPKKRKLSIFFRGAIEGCNLNDDFDCENPIKIPYNELAPWCINKNDLDVINGAPGSFLEPLGGYESDDPNSSLQPRDGYGTDDETEEDTLSESDLSISPLFDENDYDFDVQECSCLVKTAIEEESSYKLLPSEDNISYENSSFLKNIEGEEEEDMNIEPFSDFYVYIVYILKLPFGDFERLCEIVGDE